MRLAHLLIASAALTVAGCDVTPEPDEETPTEADDTSTLSIALTDIDPLADGFVYEGWIIVDGAPVTTGRFSVDGDSADLDQTVLTADLDAATAYVLTIEPEPDDSPDPSAVHIVAGDLIAGTGSLSASHPAALGVDLDAVGGDYILETPTSAGVADDYNQGIWWLDASSGTAMAALDLPALPAGWTYEGWVVVDGSPISTGTFDTPSGADSDGAGDTAGLDGAPPFPGQDFVTPATDLVGGVAVISVEPVPDTSPAPFAIKPLIDGAIEDVGAGTTQSMDEGAPLPSGTVSVQ